MTIRSTLVTQSLIDEYLAVAENEVTWGRMWGAFFKKEQLLSEWARTVHERDSEQIMAMFGLPDEALVHLANALDAAFMTGLYIGERRLEAQRGESDWIRDAFNAPSKEHE